MCQNQLQVYCQVDLHIQGICLGIVVHNDQNIQIKTKYKYPKVQKQECTSFHCNTGHLFYWLITEHQIWACQRFWFSFCLRLYVKLTETLCSVHGFMTTQFEGINTADTDVTTNHFIRFYLCHDNMKACALWSKQIEIALLTRLGPPPLLAAAVEGVGVGAAALSKSFLHKWAIIPAAKASPRTLIIVLKRSLRMIWEKKKFTHCPNGPKRTNDALHV